MSHLLRGKQHGGTADRHSATALWASHHLFVIGIVPLPNSSSVAPLAIASSLCDVEGCQLGRVQSPSFLVLSFAVADVQVPVRMERRGAGETLFCGGGPAVRGGVRTEGPAELAAGFNVDPEQCLR
jgi:hypothetical protein